MWEEWEWLSEWTVCEDNLRVRFHFVEKDIIIRLLRCWGWRGGRDEGCEDDDGLTLLISTTPHPLTHSLTHSPLTHSLTHSVTHAPPHSLTHLINMHDVVDFSARTQSGSQLKDKTRKQKMKKRKQKQNENRKKKKGGEIAVVTQEKCPT